MKGGTFEEAAALVARRAHRMQGEVAQRVEPTGMERALASSIEARTSASATRSKEAMIAALQVTRRETFM